MVRLYNAYIRIFGKLIHRNDTTEIKVVEDILRYRSKRRGKKQNITNFYRKFQIKSYLSASIRQPKRIADHRHGFGSSKSKGESS